ncbi:MAG: carboxypeptidase-like regulatory domain-containing protein [Chitinophagaceae bacterium]|nr:carboxypeptidase-like regulatory domain-containing protein [Chitinophagaceae bacterium]
MKFFYNGAYSQRFWEFYPRVFVIMKITVFLLLIGVGSVFANPSYSQKTQISIHLKNGTMKQLFEEIQKQSEFIFFYKDSHVDLNKKLNIELEKATVQQILEQALVNTNLRYKISGRQIVVLREKKQAAPEYKTERALIRQPEKIRISGKISDRKSGEAIPGATVIINNTTIGTITTISGEFSLIIPSDVKSFTVSFIGYEKQEIEIKPPYYFNVLLNPGIEELGAVVVTAQAQGQIGARLQQINSLTIKNVISAEKLQQNPDANAIEAIGRLPGISVDRSGGEGAGFRLRGLDQSYSSVTINGEPLPVGLNVISTYALQGVEVYKSLTPNLEGNAVAGTIDLTLRETPKGFHYGVMAQSGYNALNNYFSNYNFVGQVSNRFLNDKLGVLLSLNADRANRSVNLMNVGYNTNYSTNLGDPFYISNMGFNINERINYKQSAMLSLDFAASSSTTLNFHSFVSASNSYTANQSKTYAPEGTIATVPIGVNMSETPEYRNYGITSDFSGRTNFMFLNSSLHYGISHSYNKLNTPGTKSWNYNSETRADGLYRDSLKVYSPAQIADHFDDSLSNLVNTQLIGMSYDQTQANNWSLTPRLDYEIPFEIGSGLFNGKIQIGGKYRLTHNYVNRTLGNAAAGGNAVFEDYIDKTFDWSKGRPAVELLVTGQENKFLGGDYIYGDTYSFDRNNLVYDIWQQHGKDKYLAGSSGGLEDIPQYSGFIYDLNSSAMNDLDQTQQYAAGYIMPEINIGKWLMFMPGLRYEYLVVDMKAYQGHAVTRTYSVYEDLASAFGLIDTLARREDKFLLPMMHLRIKPTKWFYAHFSYTHTLRRPGSEVAPFEYYSAQDASSYSYTAGNPNLKSELWRSYDLQFTFHNSKIGLLSITGFNKTVQDKLWSRSYKRIQGDSIPNPVFRDNDLVNMTVYENHPYDIILRGLEAEWQTSFWYLPKPLSFFTLSANYTYTHGESPNPYTALYKYKPAGSRYELTGRKDSVVVTPMTGIPDHMANVTLGAKIKGFEAYLSYQYASEKIQSTHPNDLRLYVIREQYSRFDFNASYGFNLKNKGTLEILFKVANFTNSEDRIRYRGEYRPISVEQYGVTADLGVRYKF